ARPAADGFLRPHRSVQALREPQALAVAVPPRPSRPAGARSPRRSRPLASRAPSRAGGCRRRARPRDVLRGLGPPAHGAASRPRACARGDGTDGARPRRGAVPMIDHALRIVGVPGSPYSRKLRAVLRYRRIPYVWVHHGSPEARDLPQARIPLLPQLILRGPDGTPEAIVDS